jgi:hypothetical protein
MNVHAAPPAEIVASAGASHPSARRALMIALALRLEGQLLSSAISVTA